jgi:anaerobic magnesium-protoporphyrin IX monomethyl ester cyclase
VSEILFGQSYYLRFDSKLWKAMQPYPPLGTLYAAGYLRGLGYDVTVFDSMLAESEAAWSEELDRQRPRFAILYEDNFNYLSKMCLLRMRQAAFTMIAMARERGCTVIVAGSDATDHASEYLARGANFVLIGEGELTLGELMGRLTGRTDVPLESIQGLAFRDDGDHAVTPPSQAAVHQTARRPDMQDLDALPFPARDLLDVRRYQDIWRARHGYYSMNMVTTRGCPFHCNWCAKPIWGQRNATRRPEAVVNELDWLIQTYQPDHIWFADDIMGLEPGWMPRFAELVEERGVRRPFKCLSRVDLLLRKGEIEALARAGCQITWVGAESGAQHILDAMEKGTRVEQIYEAARRLHAAGVQFGYPGETREDIERTLQMVRDCQPDDVGMSVSYPLPGMPFFARVRGQLGQQQNWQDSNDLAMLYAGPFSTAFYRQLHTVLHKEFRARRHWTELKRLARHPAGLEKADLRRATAMIYHTATLPGARWRLKRLQASGFAAAGPLPPALDPQAAATPSAQPRRMGGKRP